MSRVSSPASVVILVLTIGAAGLLAASDGEGNGSKEISVTAAVTVSEFEYYAASNVFDGSSYGDLLGSIDAVIAIARRDPEAIYWTQAFEGGSPAESRSIRQVLSDGAATLNRHQPDLAEKLKLALQTLPAP